MKKRFTDAEKYDRAWFRKLEPRLKCAWDWLCSRCDAIGILHIDMERLAFEVGAPVTLDELKEHFKVVIFEGDELFLPSFVGFQYGDESGELSKGNKFHLSIASKLEARGLPLPSFKVIPEESETPTPMGIDTHPTGVGSTQGRGRGKGRGRGTGKGKGEGEESEEREQAGPLVPIDPNFPTNTSVKNPPVRVNEYIAAWCEEYSLRYPGATPEVGGYNAGTIKRLAREHSLGRFRNLVKTYLSMNDSWFVTKAHDIHTFAMNLQKVALKHDTGTSLTRKQITQMDSLETTKSQIERIREGKL